MWCCRNHLWKVTQHKMYSRDVDRWRSRVKAAVKGKPSQCQAKSSSSAANMQQCRVWIGQELLWHTCGHVSCLCLCFTSPRLISSLLFWFFWADLLSSEKMSLSSPHWVFTFLVWGTGSRFLGLEAKRLVQTWVRQKQESTAVMLEIQIDLWVWIYTNRKEERLKSV